MTTLERAFPFLNWLVKSQLLGLRLLLARSLFSTSSFRTSKISILIRKDTRWPLPSLSPSPLSVHIQAPREGTREDTVRRRPYASRTRVLTGNKPVRTFILDFPASTIWENKLLLFKPCICGISLWHPQLTNAHMMASPFSRFRSHLQKWDSHILWGQQDPNGKPNKDIRNQDLLWVQCKNPQQTKPTNVKRHTLWPNRIYPRIQGWFNT